MITRSSAVNKVQRSVISTTFDGRTGLTTPVVYRESQKSEILVENRERGAQIPD